VFDKGEAHNAQYVTRDQYSAIQCAMHDVFTIFEGQVHNHFNSDNFKLNAPTLIKVDKASSSSSSRCTNRSSQSRPMQEARSTNEEEACR
jgi:hypothetical protein